MAGECYFRGLFGIEASRDDKLKRLSEWLKANRPSCKQITLKRKDYDLIARYPKAAGLAGFTVSDGAISYDGFDLRCDRSPQRYQQPNAPSEGQSSGASEEDRRFGQPHYGHGNE